MKKRGFTLIEILLYTGIFAFVLLVISMFFYMILQTKIKNQVISELEQQGLDIMRAIVQSVRNSDSIITPAQGISSNSLALSFLDSFKNPTVFNLSGNIIKIKEGTSPEIDLNSSKVKVSSLNFYNLSKPSTPGIVKIQFTISYNNISGRSEYDYSKTFYCSTSLR